MEGQVTPPPFLTLLGTEAEEVLAGAPAAESASAEAGAGPDSTFMTKSDWFLI